MGERRRDERRDLMLRSPAGQDRRIRDRRVVTPTGHSSALREETPAPQLTRRLHSAATVWGIAVGACLASFFAGAIAFLIGYLAREGAVVCDGGVCEGFRPYLALVPLAGAVRAGVALRRRPWMARRPRGFFDETREAIADAALGSVALVLFTFFFREGFRFRGYSYSRLVFLYDFAAATLLLILIAIVVKRVLVRVREGGKDARRVIVVRDAQINSHIQTLLTRFPELGYDVVERIDIETDDPNSTDRAVRRLQDLVKVEPVDDIVLLVRNIDRDQLSKLVGVAELAKMNIRAVPELFGLPPTKVALGQMGHLPVLDLLQEPLPGGRRAVKRAIDIVVSTALLVVTLPIQAVIALAVKFSSEGPIVIRQTRIGMDGRPFEFLKYRTMIVGGDSSHHEDYVARLIKGTAESTTDDEVLFKLTHDPRVTRVGRFLRSYSLDELPQLLNVLKGEMSLVGPRPSVPFEVSMYDDWHQRRLEVRPGITGLWQVSGRSKVGFQDMVRLDISYIERWSPLLDLLIVLKTLPALLRKETG